MPRQFVTVGFAPLVHEPYKTQKQLVGERIIIVSYLFGLIAALFKKVNQVVFYFFAAALFVFRFKVYRPRNTLARILRLVGEKSDELVPESFFIFFVYFLTLKKRRSIPT